METLEVLKALTYIKAQQDIYADMGCCDAVDIELINNSAQLLRLTKDLHDFAKELRKQNLKDAIAFARLHDDDETIEIYKAELHGL